LPHIERLRRIEEGDMANIRSRDPNVKIDFILEKISEKDDIDFYVSDDMDYQFLPYRVEIDFYGTKIFTKTDYVSIMRRDLEKILGGLKTLIDGKSNEFDIESTEGDFFVSIEKADNDGDLYWVSIDMSGMLFGEDFDKTEGTALSFTFLGTYGQIEDFYKTLIEDTKKVIDDLKEKYPEEFLKFLPFYERLTREDFKIEEE